MLCLNALHRRIIESSSVARIAAGGCVVGISVGINVRQLPRRLAVDPAQSEGIDVHNWTVVRVAVSRKATAKEPEPIGFDFPASLRVIVSEVVVEFLVHSTNLNSIALQKSAP